MVFSEALMLCGEGESSVLLLPEDHQYLLKLSLSFLICKRWPGLSSCSRTSLLTEWPMDQQRQHPLGAC